MSDPSHFDRIDVLPVVLTPEQLCHRTNDIGEILFAADQAWMNGT